MTAADRAPSWNDVRACLRRDAERLREHHRLHGGPGARALWLDPSYQAVLLHRLSGFHFQHGRRLLARAFWHLNLLLTGADIGLLTRCGPGLVILHPLSTQIFGTLGRDCTLWGHGGIGGGRSAVDIGAGSGLPLVGDEVVLEARAIVLGPVRIGSRAVLSAGCIIVADVEPGTVVSLPDRLQRVVKNG